jgi:tetratricopeptide (TPR) repeat protein
MENSNYLYAKMNGFEKKSKSSQATLSQFDLDLEKEIDNYVDSLNLEEDPIHPSLQNAKARKESMKLEIKEAVKLPELSKNLNSALNLLFSEGSVYLTKEAYEQLIEDLSNASIMLNVKLEESGNDTLQHLANISDESMKSIVEVSIAKFTEERYQDCFSLFSLLTVLNPAYSEYWFRFGLAAQKCENYELASRAYAAALELDPQLVGARLFAAECFVRLGKISEARAEIETAKQFVAQNNVDPMWIDLIQAIEDIINKA